MKLLAASLFSIVIGVSAIWWGFAPKDATLLHPTALLAGLLVMFFGIAGVIVSCIRWLRPGTFLILFSAGLVSACGESPPKNYCGEVTGSTLWTDNIYIVSVHLENYGRTRVRVRRSEARGAHHPGDQILVTVHPDESTTFVRSGC